MPVFSIQISSAILLSLGLIYLRIERYINYPGSIPRVGKPGVVGFMLTALRYTIDAEAVISEGKAEYGDKPFTVPTLVSRANFEFLIIL